MRRTLAALAIAGAFRLASGSSRAQTTAQTVVITLHELPASCTVMRWPIIYVDAGANAGFYSCNPATQQYVGAGGGSMTWPLAAGIADYDGAGGWGTSYDYSNPIPASFLPQASASTLGAVQCGSGTTCTGGVLSVTAGGTGTVTNFTAGNLSPLFTSSVATPTSTPALTLSLDTQNANLVFAGPSTGSAAAPTFRALVATDIPSLTPSQVGLGNLTNDAQTKAAIVPNTAPGAGQILAGNSGGTAYAPVSVSGDCAITYAGAIACTKSGGTAFGTGAFATIANYAPLSSPTFSGTVNLPSGVSLINGGIDAQTGTSYTMIAADENKLLTLNNAAAVAVTLPQATTAGFTAGAFFHALNLGAGTVTITPTTSTVNGAATLMLATGQGADIYSDGTNYLANSDSSKIVASQLPAALANSNSVNGTSIPASATLTQTIASGTATLGTSAIASGTCAAVVTVAASGVASTDVISWSPNASIKAVTGYAPATTGGLTIAAYPTAGDVNFDVCDWASASITPGAVTLNWRVTR